MNIIRRTPRSRTLLAALCLALAGTVMLVVGTPTTNSSLAAKLTNTTNTVASGTFANCTSIAKGNSAYFVYPFNDASGFTANDVSGNNRPGSYSLTGITYAQPGPCPRDYAQSVTLNGSTGNITSVGISSLITAPPTVYSVEIWFKTTVGGGQLVGIDNSLLGISLQADRHVFLSNTGSLNFSVDPSGTTIAIGTGTTTYLDGKWHNVIATQAGSSDANPGMRLYVDGALVASNPTATASMTIIGAAWRIGFDNLGNAGPNAPSNNFFTGSLAFSSYYASVALTPAQVLAHYQAGI